MPQSPEAALHSYMAHLATGLRTLVPQAIGQWDEQAIHHARVSTRRLKAALDLLGDELPRGRSKSFRKSLKTLRRQLGPLRDTDIMLDHLRELAGTAALKPAAHWLSQVLLEEREALRRTCQKKTSLPDLLAGLDGWKRLESVVQKVETQAPVILSKTLPRQLGEFARDARQVSAGKGRLDVHLLRIAGKLLRYTLEIAAATGHPLPPQTAATFKKLQDALGLWHDHIVLAGQIMRSAADRQLALHDPALFNSVLALLRAVWTRSQSHLRSFGKLWSRDGEVLTGQIAELFPTNRSGEPS